MRRDNKNRVPDVCLILEGTYPYVSGGVSGWTHELITNQSHLSFCLLTILPPGEKRELKYDVPGNVVEIKDVFLHRLDEGKKLTKLERKELLKSLEAPITELQNRGRLPELRKTLEIIAPFRKRLGREVLLNSKEAWELITKMYDASVPSSSFLDYFWTWRALLGGMYSILLAEVPEARCYHALCTGFAGLFLARAKIEKNKACLLTEHGIYTNERRIEINSADWLEDRRSLNLNIERSKEKGLKDLWIDTFTAYSRLCYDSCDAILTLYEGNTELQLEDGAQREQLDVIPNGIDYERFAAIERAEDHPPTVALIGRVVPIKDVKTFLRAIILLKAALGSKPLRVWVMGPTDEDEDYFQECQEIVAYEKLEETVFFTGKVKIDEYLGEIDAIALTSLSEAQPLVLLEAGAAGIPSVATEVGACREIIQGRSDESPRLGNGGIVCSLSSAAEIAIALERLLVDKEFYDRCSSTMKKRVETYYNKVDQHAAYKALYAKHTG